MYDVINGKTTIWYTENNMGNNINIMGIMNREINHQVMVYVWKKILQALYTPLNLGLMPYGISFVGNTAACSDILQG